MNKNTILIISTPNAINLDNFIKWFFGFETFHDDHKVIFTYWYLKNLLKFNWIKVEKWYFTILDYDKKDLNWKWKTSIFIQRFILRYFANTLLFVCKKEE
jgi:hypothetical protein